jgi:hypothetical protein
MRKLTLITVALITLPVASFAGVLSGAASDGKALGKASVYSAKHAGHAAKAVGKAGIVTLKALSKV